MPRAYVTAERTLLAGNYNVYTRVEVKDSDGTWRDLTAYTGSRNFFVSATWTRQLDAPVMSGSVVFLRSVLGASLAPTVVGSIMNTNAASAYVPLLVGGRPIRISTNCTALGVAPVSADWREVFLGRIDDPDWGGDDGTITVTISDVGAWLLGKQIETEKQYGSSGGTALETVIQQILSDNISTPLGAVTLSCPTSPGWNIHTYTQAKGSLLTAIRALALQIGWDVRYVYDAGNVYRLTLFQPQRTKTVADYSLPAAEYYALPEVSQNLGDVRTRIGGSYVDAATTTRLWRYVQSDAAHTNQYDVVYMEISEDASSNIDSSTEMDKMLNAALSDLQDPASTVRAEDSYFWIAELGDLIAFPSNSVHFDGTQNVAVVGIVHTLDASGETTALTCRGKVAGNVKEWLVTAGPASPSAPAPNVGHFYSETFDVLPTEGQPARYTTVTPGAISLVPSGTVGRNVLQMVGADFRYLRTPIAFNPSKLYRLRAKFKQTVDGAAGTMQVYLGLRCYDATGALIGLSAAAWALANNVAITTAGGTQELTGWARGATLATSAASASSSDPRAPAALYSGTVAVAPAWAFNQSGGTGTAQLDYFQIDELDEDAEDRLYNSLDSGYSLAQKVLQYDDPTSGSTLTKRPLKGYQAGTCYDGQTITFSPAFKKNPMIVFSRGNNTITYQPDSSKWSNSAGFLSTKAQIEDVYAIMAAMEGTGFTCHAKLRQQGGSTPNNVDFPSGNNLTAAGTATQLTVPAAAPSSSGHYTVRYVASVTTQSTKPGVARTATIVVVINKRAGGGSGAITQLDSKTYTVTDPDGTGPYMSTTGMQSLDVVATLASGDVIEISISTFTHSGSTLGSDSCSVHGAVTAADGVAGLSFTSGAADNFTTMTAATPITTPVGTDTLRWEAYSVA